jgi:uncharacterized protein YjbJ (UPF0337 family)
MKTTLPWILAGVGASVATYLMFRQQQGLPQFATNTGAGFGSGTGTGLNAVDDAANRTSTWGDKQRLAGAGSNLLGKVKEGLGRVTGNDSLAAEGTADQAAGSVRNATGAVANAAGKTLKDLNF